MESLGTSSSAHRSTNHWVCMNQDGDKSLWQWHPEILQHPSFCLSFTLSLSFFPSQDKPVLHQLPSLLPGCNFYYHLSLHQTPLSITLSIPHPFTPPPSALHQSCSRILPLLTRLLLFLSAPPAPPSSPLTSHECPRHGHPWNPTSKRDTVPPHTKKWVHLLIKLSTDRTCYLPTYITPSLVLAAASSMPALVFSAAATTPSLAMENPFISTSILGDETAGLPCSKRAWLADWCLQWMCRRDVRSVLVCLSEYVCVCRWLLLPLVLHNRRFERTVQQGSSTQTERERVEETTGTHEMERGGGGGGGGGGRGRGGMAGCCSIFKSCCSPAPQPSLYSHPSLSPGDSHSRCLHIFGLARRSGHTFLDVRTVT